MVNVGNRQFLKEDCEFLSVIWVKWEQSICSITSSTFYILFLPCFFLEIFKFKYDKFSSDILLPFPNPNDLNSRGTFIFIVLIFWFA